MTVNHISSSECAGSREQCMLDANRLMMKLELNFALENLLLTQKLGWPMGYFLGRGYFNK